MAGCWIMRAEKDETTNIDGAEQKSAATRSGQASDAEKTEEEDDENMQDKIIVRSNGTVTYVGKDIAYQLWKFGLLGKDFRYAKWPHAPKGEEVWTTTSGAGEGSAPHFGAPARTVYNVIDTRQAYPQAVVRIGGIRRKGMEQAAAEAETLKQESVAGFLNGEEGESFWDLVLLAGSLDHAMDAAVGAQEPAFVAKFAFQLAQAFNLFYHQHHILSEADPQKKAFLLLLTELVERQLVAALSLLGIEAPEKM